MPDHPDQEQLAAYQAGDVDRRERLDVEAHLAACPSCAELVASVGRARGSLALLEEPDLPPGLHDRLTAALESSTAEAGEADRRFGSQRSARATGSPGSLEAAGSGGLARRAWSPGFSVPRPGTAGPRPGAPRPPCSSPPWSSPSSTGPPAPAPPPAVTPAAAQPRKPPPRPRPPPATSPSSGSRARSPPTQSASGSRPTPRRRPPSAAPLPPGHRPGRRRPPLQHQDPRAQHRGPRRRPAPSHPTPAPRPPPPAPEAPSAGGQPPAAGALQRQSCLPAASAAANAAIRPLAPAFFIEGTYKGRPATILVTTSTSQPDRVDLWVFPRNNCSSVLDTERVR